MRHLLVAIVAILASLWSFGGYATDFSKQLFITDPSVVDSSEARTGRWSFAGVFRNLAGASLSAELMVKDWLLSFESDQTENSFVVAGKPGIRGAIIEPWKTVDGHAGVSDAAWQPNLDNAPFRLLAIVNRIDLAKCNKPLPLPDCPTNDVQHAGEGRFIFGAFQRMPDGSAGGPMQFLVIFEFEQPARTFDQLVDWAVDWSALENVPFGAGFNIELMKITDGFASAGIVAGKPNDSALNQVRTDEVALGGPWELREYSLSRSTGGLALVTSKQTPDLTFNGSPSFALFVNLGLREMPPSFDGQPFLAGSSINTFPVWQAAGIRDNNQRHRVALNTCSGCHGAETGTGFLHITNRADGGQSTLSGFLNGTTIVDPVDQTTPRIFADLLARSQILQALVDTLQKGGDLSSIENLLEERRFRVH